MKIVSVFIIVAMMVTHSPSMRSSVNGKCLVETHILRERTTYILYMNECAIKQADDENVIGPPLIVVGLNIAQIKFIVFSYFKYLNMFSKGDGMYLEYRIGSIVPIRSWAG